MDGYLNAPNPCVEGWYPSGDVCYRLGDVYYYVGRRDFQVKLRGQRIELGEIESVLGHQAVVVKDPERERLIGFVVMGMGMKSEDKDDNDGYGVVSDVETCAFLLSGEEAESYERSVLEECRRRLPEYMVPSRVLCMSRMPLNANGKADRNELLRVWSEMQMQIGTGEVLDVEETLTMEESRVREVWARALGESRPERISVEISLQYRGPLVDGSSNCAPAAGIDSGGVRP